MTRTLLLASVALALAAPAAAQPVTSPRAFDQARLAKHIQTLASDAYEGRAPGTPGEAKTTSYIVQQFQAAGLQPGGVMAAGQRSWFQPVPLGRYQAKGPVAPVITAKGERIPLTQGEQIAVRANQWNVDRVSVQDAPLVFVGYGVSAPERNWDDFKGVDLKGKVAVVLINDPDFDSGTGEFGGKAMTYYGRWTYKYEEAARRGAAGVLIVHETAPASYGWQTVRNSNANGTYDIVRRDPKATHPQVEAWIQRDVAVDLFKRAGLDFDALKKTAQTRAFKPVELTGQTFSLDYAVDHSVVQSKNIIGVLPGTKRPDEVVMYTGHWDHLGVGPADARGDTIYNGAIDNADGIAGLIELGRAFARAPRPERTVAIMTVTAEERGLLGTEYYVSNPVYPLGKTVGVINIDALDAAGSSKDVGTSGDVKQQLQDELIAVARRHGKGFAPDSNPGAGYFYRSDHFPFAKRGVPALSIESGQDLVRGGKAAGKAWKDKYTADRYHQPADEWSAAFNLAGQTEDLAIAYDLGRELANSARWPDWAEGTEFKAARDKTAAERR